MTIIFEKNKLWISKYQKENKRFVKIWRKIFKIAVKPGFYIPNRNFKEFPLKKK